MKLPLASAGCAHGRRACTASALSVRVCLAREQTSQENLYLHVEELVDVEDNAAQRTGMERPKVAQEQSIQCNEPRLDIGEHSFVDSGAHNLFEHARHRGQRGHYDLATLRRKHI